MSLFASWTAAVPAGRTTSLAKQVSDGLGQFRVRGINGFLWLQPDGQIRVTRQAYTVWRTGGDYRVADDQPVLASLALGELALYSDRIRKSGTPELMLAAAAGWDIYFLCPERALAEFEALAPRHPIAAYNAAVMRLEDSGPEARTAALDLLALAIKQGDDTARRLLDRLVTESANTEPAPGVRVGID